MIKRVFSLLNLVLVTVFIYLGVNVFYKIATATLEVPAVVVPFHQSSSAISSEMSPSLAQYKPITERNLFNMDLGTRIKPEKLAIDTLTQTDLKVKLWGTVTGNDGRPYAVIEEARGKQQNLYRVGDTIQNATVKMILREKVVLHVNGKDEILEMEKVQSGRVAPARQRISRAPRTSSATRAPLEQNIVLKRSQIEEALKDPGALATQVKVRPHFTNGRPDGLLFTGIKPNSIFRRTGLRNGDILTGINEEEIQTIDDALKFYQDLSSSGGGTIQIKRRGRVQIFNYTVE